MTLFKYFSNSRIGSLICNIILSYFLFFLARIIFFIVNCDYFVDYMSWELAIDMLNGALKFDTSAVIYVNALYILMMLFPLHIKETKTYHKITKWIYVTFNSVALAANLADAIYFQFTGRRTTATVFNEFSNEGNIMSIIGTEFINHWYLVLLFILLAYGLSIAYRIPFTSRNINLKSYYITQSISMIAAIPLCIFGIRGGIGPTVRPITISNANQYVNRPIETAVVLNTPFSIIRTIGKEPFETPHYMTDELMRNTFDPTHQPAKGSTFRPRNVVVMIVESFGKEYIGAFNKDLDNGTYKGFTPFTDSLIQHSLTFVYSFGNGRKSIDGMPSVLSGIPMFVEPFFLTPASLNNVTSIAGELDNKGYYTAFFHGAPNGSMGFQAFARTVGFKDYYGLDEYSQAAGHDADKDFDGTWAIWDEPFMQYYCEEMSTFKEPFMTSIFTASSHHPYVIPDEYKQTFHEGTLPIHKCIRYTDNALRKFFEKAKKQKWFNNTLFVITADHTNQSCHESYQNDLGVFKVPIIFYAPGDTTLTGMRNDIIAQQIDIMPTVLGYLGYDKPYVAFGCDLLSTPPQQTFAVNYANDIYQYVKGEYLLQFDGNGTRAVYNFKSDPLLKHNLVGKVDCSSMELELKAIIQQYMQRMNENRLTTSN